MLLVTLKVLLILWGTGVLRLLFRKGYNKYLRDEKSINRALMTVDMISIVCFASAPELSGFKGMKLVALFVFMGIVILAFKLFLSSLNDSSESS